MIVKTDDHDKVCFHGGAFFQGIGEDCQTLERRNDIINADVLDAWFDPSPKVLEAITAHLPWIARTSPPTNCTGLIDAIATARGVPSSCILPGAGSSDLIFLALRHYIKKSSKVLILDPMYGEYAHICKQVIGCDLDYFPLHLEDQFQINIKTLSQQLLSKSYDMVIMVNPNSPTGQYLDQQVFQDLIAQIPNKTMFWIDETYIEYVGSAYSLESFACMRENVIVCKSMSKVYALSGFRAAYLCASAALIEPLRLLNPPWSVSLPGQIAAIYALQDPSYYQEKYQQTLLAGKDMQQELESMGIRVIPSVASFLLMFLPSAGPSAQTVVQAAQKQGVYLRDASNMGRGLGTHALRSAIKGPLENKKIISVIKSALSSV